MAPSNLQAFSDHIRQGKAFDWLVRMAGGDSVALTQTLYDSHNVGMVWYIMGVIGILSAIGIWITASGSSRSRAWTDLRRFDLSRIET